MFNMRCCFSVTPVDPSLEYAGVIKAGVLCQGNPIASFIPFHHLLWAYNLLCQIHP